MANVLNIALTGASGFVGGHILSCLLTAGHKVRALVRTPAQFRPHITDSKLTVVQGTLFDDAALTELVSHVDAVIHVVGIIMENPHKGQTFDRVHVQGTGHLLAVAGAAKVKRWVHMSALGARPQALSAYHRTKWDAETAVHRSGMDYTIFRPSIIHGPDGEFMQMVKSFWCKLLPPFVPYFGAGFFGTGGAGTLQPIWVDDVARCFTDSLTRAQTIGETYSLGGPDRYTWPDFYRAVARHLPKARRKKILALPVWKAKILARLPGTPFNIDQVIMSQEDAVCDIAKVQSDFNFEPASFEPQLVQYAAHIK